MGKVKLTADFVTRENIKRVPKQSAWFTVAGMAPLPAYFAFARFFDDRSENFKAFGGLALGLGVSLVFICIHIYEGLKIVKRYDEKLAERAAAGSAPEQTEAAPAK